MHLNEHASIDGDVVGPAVPKAMANTTRVIFSGGVQTSAAGCAGCDGAGRCNSSPPSAVAYLCRRCFYIMLTGAVRAYEELVAAAK